MATSVHAETLTDVAVGDEKLEFILRFISDHFGAKSIKITRALRLERAIALHMMMLRQANSHYPNDAKVMIEAYNLIYK